MSTATQVAPRAVHRADYRVPDFLVDTVDLTFALDPAATRVTSRLAIRRNPAGTEPGAPLRLDGEGLTLVSLQLDGQALDAGRYTLEPSALVVPEAPDSFVLEIEARIAPAENSELSGLYTSGDNYYT
ncbi:MAG TPA: aminopeptidase N, partial [Acetobacteraceae bacterium]|nr:aminopeptidase N [Acetobacteraceae bacterium]